MSIVSFPVSEHLREVYLERLEAALSVTSAMKAAILEGRWEALASLQEQRGALLTGFHLEALSGGDSERTKWILEQLVQENQRIIDQVKCQTLTLKTSLTQFQEKKSAARHYAGMV